MPIYLLTEDSKGRPSTRKYKCPLCDHRNTRDRLIDHVTEEHSSAVTDEFPAERLIYNSINKITAGKCRICGKETKWDPDKSRYDAFCSDRCKDEYVKIAKERMKKKYGKEHILDDPTHQQKMLNNRSISGLYTFTSGGKMPYVGSYERKFLEFMDVFMHVKTIDLVASYPVVEYEYPHDSGEKHFWILDYYYAPLNLAIDIKDGGDNPNNREMPEYREKQNAKEYAIVNQRVYNYIRLENNDFKQLILTMLEMKDLPDNEVLYDSKIQGMSRYAYIPESLCSPSPMIGIGQEPRLISKKESIYFVFAQNKLSTVFGLSFDNTLKKIWMPNESFELKAYAEDFLDDYEYKVYEFKDQYRDYHIHKLKEKMKNTFVATPSNIYEHFTGRPLLDYMQLEYDTELFECMTLPDYLKMIESSVIATLTDDVSIPMLESTDESYPYDFAQDINGYYVFNKTTNYRSRSYPTVDSIPNVVKKYISGGVI